MKKPIEILAVAAMFAMAMPMSAESRGSAAYNSGLKVVSEWQSGLPAVTSTVHRAPAKAPSLKNVRLNGFMMYDDDKSEDVKGFYEYSITAPISRRPLLTVPRQYVGGDAVVKDGKLYSCHVEVSFGFVNSCFYTSIDVTTGQASKSSNISYELGPAMEHSATSAAVNPVDGTVYASSYTYNSSDNTLTPTLKTWDVTANTKTVVGTMEAMLAVMAFDAEGNLYGITSSSSKTADDGGRLVKVNTTTGSLTLIGDTGVRPWFDQSGVIYPGDGRLYWFANEPIAGNDADAAKSALYAVNLATAQIEEIGELPNGDEVVAAWVPAQTIANEAPGVVENLATSFTGASLTGNVTFSLPSESYSGAALGSDLEWTVKNGDAVSATGNGVAGGAVSSLVTVEKSGTYTFSVCVSNEFGSGPVQEITTYIGYGVPKAATNVTFAIEGDQNVVSWTHADGLVGAGYLEGEHPLYNVVRQPGNVVLAENYSGNTFTEPALSGALQSTYYEVITVNGDMTGATAKSNALVTGSSLALPYSEDFTDASSFDLYTAIDANGDNNTWYYSVKSAKIRQVTFGSQDDWLILPPVELEKGLSYEFKFNCYALQVSNVNILDVAMGKSVENMDIVLLSDLEVANTKSTAMKEVAITIKPTETAVYRLGIHLKSASRQGTFTVDDVTISAGASAAIPAAPEVSAHAGEKGALSATLTIAIPTLTAGGEALENRPTQFEILRNGATLATIDTTAENEEYTYTDSAIETSGLYTYSITAINSDGKGEATDVDVFVGTDTPMAPTGFAAKDNFDGTVTLSWDEPSEVGMNGGYVALEHLRYTITHPDGTQTAGIEGQNHTADHETTGTQKEVSYKLAVHYVDADPLATHTVTSNNLIAGESYKGAFEESFPVADGVASASTAIWTKELVSGKSSQFSMAMRTDDHTGDGSGCLHFTGYAADAAGRWISPVIDLSEVSYPEVSLWVKTFDSGSNFELQVSKEYGDWETVAVPESTEDWTEVKASLANYRSKHVRLGMLARSNSNMNFTYADDIKVQNVIPTEVENIAADADANKEIYTIEGLRVEKAVTPGIYIIRKGNATEKVIIR